ncbi:hypothetical protein D9756_010609 [Leucocoprinus leucothites]|uniref:3'(2'),5'-bisphosphate nucleotidase n=1 Tax=Leucocoprinus leucothites TaxID=201217 RepID=A0A8H5CTN9_9AGAR|nr:hypothetical protein D9756_010609 [Leucoagaricus leucothites]
MDMMLQTTGQPTLPWHEERAVAISAVRRACIVTQKVFETLVNTDYMTKNDQSPVTVGDYAAQAVIASILGTVFPEDPIVGEEDAAELRKSENKELTHHVTGLVNEGLTDERLPYEKEEWAIGVGYDISPREVRDAIDRGNYEGGSVGRMWTIDPIDGTKGFLRGEQYAVCLSLLIDGKPTVAVIGCPNLPHRTSKPDGPKGYIFVAVKDQGAERLSMKGFDPTIITMPTVHPADLIMLESVESGHSSHSFNSRVSELLTIEEPPMRMDSQAKYCALAMGRGQLYLRMPTRADYEEKIWDHAPGSLLIEEAGGVVTDSRGNSLDFGMGRTLGKNNGIVACSKYVHPKVLDAIRVAMREGRKRAKSREALKAAAAAAANATPEPENPPPHEPTQESRDTEKENRPMDDAETYMITIGLGNGDRAVMGLPNPEGSSAMGVFGGTIWGVVYVVKQVTESVQATKQKMKEKGYDISGKGVSIKTSKRFDRQDYIDATQRGMMKTMTATSFNRRADSIDGSHSPNSNSSARSSPVNSATASSFSARPAVQRAMSSNSAKSAEKKSLFGSNKNTL